MQNNEQMEPQEQLMYGHVYLIEFDTSGPSNIYSTFPEAGPMKIVATDISEAIKKATRNNGYYAVLSAKRIENGVAW